MIVLNGVPRRCPESVANGDLATIAVMEAENRKREFQFYTFLPAKCSMNTYLVKDKEHTGETERHGFVAKMKRCQIPLMNGARCVIVFKLLRLSRCSAKQNPEAHAQN